MRTVAWSSTVPARRVARAAVEILRRLVGGRRTNACDADVRLAARAAARISSACARRLAGLGLVAVSRQPGYRYTAGAVRSRRRRPLLAAIGRRRQYINSLVSDYDRYQAEAASLRAQAEEIRAAARREAEHRVASVRATASNEAAVDLDRLLAQSAANRRTSPGDRPHRTRRGRAGEPEAVRGLADFMLERVIPEAAR